MRINFWCTIKVITLNLLCCVKLQFFASFLDLLLLHLCLFLDLANVKKNVSLTLLLQAKLYIETIRQCPFKSDPW